MKILIVNPIIYTSESAEIKKAKSIKDTMIYDLCLAFKSLGHQVELVACEDYKPITQEEYPFNIIWLKAKYKKIFKPNVLPYCPDVKSVALKGKYDLIISSEVFSLNTFILARCCKNNLIIWHELAKHNRLMKQIPSKIWYGVVARLFFGRVPVVPRSIEARDFISKYCKNICKSIIDHGVNLEKFTPCTEKENCFCISSQLIPRKRIHLAIDAFSKYLGKYNPAATLYIMGEGEEADSLKELTKKLNCESNVIFTGKLAHSELIDILRKSRAMLVYTEKDNNMVSIVESIAVATPVITTSVPYNATYIKENSLGIVNDLWGENELNEISINNKYINNCLEYRQSLSTLNKANEFIDILSKYCEG